MATELDYTYLAASALSASDGVARLGLATSGGSTLDGATTHPYFFSGFVEHPDVVAAALLVVARVARTRFYVPPSMLAAMLRAADPVVTSTAQGLRFESFSACCGVYARLDVDAAALDASHVAVGVTNVDVNPTLRQALSGLRGGEPLQLDVGAHELRVRTLDAEVTEEKVTLPARWLKGFAETQFLSAGMSLRHSVDRAGAMRFIQALPRMSSTRTVMWAARVPRGLRLASRASADAVCVAGPERLRVLEPLLRHALGLRAFGACVDAASTPLPSAWVLELPGARLTIALSPEKSRGFSGEGAVLPLLAGTDAADDADLISALLAFEPRIEMSRLESDSGLDSVRVAGALSVLASSGQVGYDVAAAAYFHRPLPVHPDALSALHPRLADARTLVDAGAVTAHGDGDYRVRSGAVDYSVRSAAGAVADASCTCPWYAKYRGARGPCKHVLAVSISVGR